MGTTAIVAEPLVYNQSDPAASCLAVVRPYALLSGWASVIPGVFRSSMTIEQGGPPLLGADTLPDPWSNPLVTRIQSASNPVLVADQDYWDATKMSDANGDWPASVPTIAAGATVTRTLLVFNDTFSGTAVDVTWELHADSPTGAIASSGTLNLNVPLGTMSTQSITVTFPASGSAAFLVLHAQKNGTTVFEETGESFVLGSPLYTIVNHATGMLAEVSGQSMTLGASVDQWSANGGTNQEWRIVTSAAGGFTLVNVNSDLAIAVGTSGVVQEPANGAASQTWTLSAASAGYSILTSGAGGVLTSPSASQGAGLVIMPASSGDASEEWMLVPPE